MCEGLCYHASWARSSLRKMVSTISLYEARIVMGHFNWIFYESALVFNKKSALNQRSNSLRKGSSSYYFQCSLS